MQMRVPITVTPDDVSDHESEAAAAADCPTARQRGLPAPRLVPSYMVPEYENVAVDAEGVRVAAAAVAGVHAEHADRPATVDGSDEQFVK